jgi:[calcium/calmodulin-dependent protein kinase] kinase
MEGNFPLKSHRDLKKGETNELHDLLPVEGRTFWASNPRPDSLSGLANLSKHERSFKEGDNIMRQGENGEFKTLKAKC